MEMKWFAILVVGVFSTMFTTIAFEKYSAGQCKIAYAGTNKSADEILKLCGK